MGRYIIKPRRDDDLYILWSTVIDGPLTWGSRADLGAELEDDGWTVEQANKKIAIADDQGDTRQVGARNTPWDPNQTYLVAGGGIRQLTRDQISELVHAIGDGGDVDGPAATAYLEALGEPLT